MSSLWYSERLSLEKNEVKMFDDLIHQALFVSGIHNLFDLTLDILDLVLWHVIQRRDLVIIKRQLRTNLVEQIQ